MAAALVLLTLVFSSTSTASDLGPSAIHSDFKEAKLRVGLIMGEPAGLTLAVPLRRELAVHAGVGIPFGVADISASTDLVFRWPELIGSLGAKAHAVVWFGLGGRWTHEPEIHRFGVRVPFGVSILSTDGSGELFFEVTPGLALNPELRTLIEGGVGIRLRAL